MFDLGNTLVRLRLPELIYRDTLSSLGISKSLKEIREAVSETEKRVKKGSHRSPHSSTSREEHWHTYDSLVLQYLGISKGEKLIAEVQARWFDHEDCRKYPDVERTLNKGKQMGLRLGLISTAYVEDIRIILTKAGLDEKLFDIIVGADTTKDRKPHPAVFRFALARLQVKPQEALFVGDSLESDYRGAEKAGIHALLLQRRKANIPGIRDLKVICRLEMIFEYVNHSNHRMIRPFER
jgi:putative hydrolase of the HAD superfamily